MQTSLKIYLAIDASRNRSTHSAAAAFVCTPHTSHEQQPIAPSPLGRPVVSPVPRAEIPAYSFAIASPVSTGVASCVDHASTSSPTHVLAMTVVQGAGVIFGASPVILLAVAVPCRRKPEHAGRVAVLARECDCHRPGAWPECRGYPELSPYPRDKARAQPLTEIDNAVVPAAADPPDMAVVDDLRARPALRFWASRRAQMVSRVQRVKVRECIDVERCLASDVHASVRMSTNPGWRVVHTDDPVGAVDFIAPLRIEQ